MQQHHPLVVCEHCDALHRWVPLSGGELARCSRCAAVLARGHRMGVLDLLALTIAAAATLLVANFMPIVDVGLRGTHATATLPQAVVHTWEAGAPLVASFSALTAIVAPALLIGVRLLVLVPLAMGRVSPWFSTWMRILHEAARWSMVEVLMVAAAVSIVRLAALSDATPGPGMFAFGALSLLLAGLESAGLRHLWLERRDLQPSAVDESA